MGLEWDHFISHCRPLCSLGSGRDGPQISASSARLDFSHLLFLKILSVVFLRRAQWILSVALDEFSDDLQLKFPLLGINVSEKLS